MSKHPLLPHHYTDSATKSAILFALSPYKITLREDIANPNLKWNLSKAWQDAETVLARRNWKYRGAGEELEKEYEFSADSESEVEELNLIIAGLVAYEILEPESGVAIRRLEYKKGGEVSIIISKQTTEILKQLFPGTQQVEETGNSNNLLTYFRRLFCRKKN